MGIVLSSLKKKSSPADLFTENIHTNREYATKSFFNDTIMIQKAVKLQKS